jgi:hypothetical protein
MSSLTELLQGQNDRITGLEDFTLDSNLILPKVEKVYDGITISAKIKVVRAKYYLCSEIDCDVDQINTKEYEVVYT